MKKRTFAILVLVICLLAALPAMADNIYRFSKTSVTVYAGETEQLDLTVDGKYLDGTVTWNARNPKAVSVDQNGIVTGLEPGRSYVDAVLMRDGKKIATATATVNVVRRVTKVTLNVEKSNLMVYEPDDETILPLLRPRTEEEEPITDRILVLPSGRYFSCTVAITPDDVSAQDKRWKMETSDVGILKVSGTQMVAVQPGECDVVISSVQTPEVQEKFHVLVTQPVKKIQVQSETKTVPVGGSLQLDTVVTPDTASIKDVIWSSRNEKAATVDENGVVTGVNRGTATILATAADGSKVVGQITLTVIQDVTDIEITEPNVTVATKRQVQLHWNALPKNADNKRVTWTSSDESIAKVNASGVVTGVKAGDCLLTCTSQSNPYVSASIPVRVTQPVTKITVTTPKGLSFNVGESRQLDWVVSPDDATSDEVRFNSRAPKVATVDANGIVTGLSKGAANIEVIATDGTNVKATYQVNITQPVTGIQPLGERYFTQLGAYRKLGGSTRVLPTNANNQKIHFTTSDPRIATISNGQVYGAQRGTVTVTATTDEGGFSTSAELIVDDFDQMIICTSIYVDDNNKIRLSLLNTSPYFTVNRINYKIECFDTQGYPMVCNKDGTSTSWEGSYNYAVLPNQSTQHGQFSFTEYQENPDLFLGYVTVTVTGFQFDNGQRWNVPGDIQDQTKRPSPYSGHWGEPTPTPVPTFAPPEVTPAPEAGNG